MPIAEPQSRRWRPDLTQSSIQGVEVPQGIDYRHSAVGVGWWYRLRLLRHGGGSHRHARCFTDQQDLTTQRDALAALGVVPARVYVDHGLTGINRDRQGLRESLAACREGDTLMVAKLDRLARSLPDARAIADELTARQDQHRRLGYDPTMRFVSGGTTPTWPLSISDAVST